MALDNIRNRVVYVNDSPANIASFVGEYLEEVGVVKTFNRDLQAELEKTIMKKFGGMPEDMTEAVEVTSSLAAGTVVGLGFTLQKWATSTFLPFIGPIIVGVEDALRIPEISRSLVKKLIAMIFDVEEDVVERITGEDRGNERIFDRILNRRNRNRDGGLLSGIKDRIKQFRDRDRRNDDDGEGFIERMVDRIGDRVGEPGDVGLGDRIGERLSGRRDEPEDSLAERISERLSGRSDGPDHRDNGSNEKKRRLI